MNVSPHTSQPDLTGLGSWTPPDTMTVEVDRLRRFAAATQDDTPAYAAGEVASPVFAVLPAWRTAFPLLIGILPPELRTRSLHSAQDITYHRPLLPGMTLRTRAALVGAVPASGGTSLVARSVTEWGGEPVLDQYTVAFVRGFTLPDLVGDAVPPRRQVAAGTDGLLAVREDRFRPEQGPLYAEASGDHQPIHLDPAVAAEHGFPSPIVFGNCTFAMTSRHVVQSACGGSAARLRRLAVRFRRPVFFTDSIRTRVHRTPDPGIVHWEAEVPGRGACIDSGYAEVIV